MRSAAARSPCSGVLFATTTAAPADASPSPMANPIPREPPATIATFSDKSKSALASTIRPPVRLLKKTHLR